MFLRVFFQVSTSSTFTVHPIPFRELFFFASNPIDLEASHAVVSEESLQMIPEDLP